MSQYTCTRRLRQRTAWVGVVPGRSQPLGSEEVLGHVDAAFDGDHEVVLHAR